MSNAQNNQDQKVSSFFDTAYCHQEQIKLKQEIQSQRVVPTRKLSFLLCAESC